LLSSSGVDYVIVGAQSLAFHGRPRYTGDLDILVRPTLENARLLVRLLNQFGFAHSGLRENDFIEPDQMFVLPKINAARATASRERQYSGQLELRDRGDG